MIIKAWSGALLNAKARIVVTDVPSPGLVLERGVKPLENAKAWIVRVRRSRTLERKRLREPEVQVWFVASYWKYEPPRPGFEPGIPWGTSFLHLRFRTCPAPKFPGLRNTRLCDLGMKQSWVLSRVPNTVRGMRPWHEITLLIKQFILLIKR